MKKTIKVIVSPFYNGLGWKDEKTGVLFEKSNQLITYSFTTDMDLSGVKEQVMKNNLIITEGVLEDIQVQDNTSIKKELKEAKAKVAELEAILSNFGEEKEEVKPEVKPESKKETKKVENKEEVVEEEKVEKVAEATPVFKKEDLEKLTNKELRAKLDENKITHKPSDNKNDLVDLLLTATK